jgi:recombination protein RecR
MHYPLSIQNLIDRFSELPTVGRKTAERFVFFLLRQEKEKLNDFAEAILHLKERIKVCQVCYSISETVPCSICSDPKRNNGQLLIVASYRDLLTIETLRIQRPLPYFRRNHKRD